MLRGFLRRNTALVPHGLMMARHYAAPAESKAISMDTVWSLWNEGNLFSLSVGELQSFLQSQNVDVGGDEKKTSLVRKVEDLMSKEQPSLVRADETAVASLFEGEGNSGSGDLYEEADLYGDWGLDAGLSNRNPLHDAMHIGLGATGGVAGHDPLDVRALQVLHENTTPDVVMVPLDTSKLPGSLKGAQAFTFHQADAHSSNRVRFSKAFQWGITNMWNLGYEGNMNVTYGRTLLNQKVQLFKRTVLPMWSVQKALAAPHTGRFVALAHERNTQGVTNFLQEHGYQVETEPTTSYLVAIKKREPVVLELNAELQPTNALRAWDRNVVTHYVRLKMPDARFMLRGRAPLKKRVASPYFESEILRFKQNTVESVLAPELGDVHYVAERVISTWSKKVDSGLVLRIMQTKRTPLVTTKDIDSGERLEYEIDAALPAHQEGLDLNAMACDVFNEAVAFASALEPGLVSFKANSVAALEEDK